MIFFLMLAIEHHEVHLGLQELVGDLELYGKAGKGQRIMGVQL
jgi:hypothetical protein